MKHWSHLRVMKQENANNPNYINLKVFENTNVDPYTIKNVLRFFSSTLLKDLTK